MTVTGKDLIDLGFPAGPALGAALRHVQAHGLEGEALMAFLAMAKPAPRLPLQPAPGYALNLEADSEAEQANLSGVTATMDLLMRTPTVRAGAVMPDACPAGPVGTIPVGGVVVAQNAIHPGMHSADICRSLMLTDFADADPAAVLDAVHAVTHFGRAEGPRVGAFRCRPVWRKTSARICIFVTPRSCAAQANIWARRAMATISPSSAAPGPRAAPAWLPTTARAGRGRVSMRRE